MSEASDSPPPAFPPWLRALDPALAREDTNALFQAFRARRWRRHGLAIRLRDMGPGFLWLIQFLVWPIVSQLCRGPGWASRLLAFLLSCAAFGALAGFTVVLRRGGGLPLRLADIYDLSRSPGWSPTVIEDLWLLPLSGEEVVEALYLESRDGILTRPWQVAFAGTTLALSIYLYTIPPALDDLWKELLPAGLLFGMLVRGLFLYLRYGAVATARAYLLKIVRLWQSRVTGNPAKELVARPFMMIGIAAASAFLMIPVLLCFGGVFVDALLSMVRWSRALSVSACLVLAWGLFELVVRLWRNNTPPPDFDEVRRMAREYYEPYMRKQVAGE